MSITKRVKQLIENKDDFKAVDDFELIEFAKELDKDFVLVPREEVETIQGKFKSGNSVDVERVTISRIDVDRLLKMSFDRYPLITAHEGEN